MQKSLPFIYLGLNIASAVVVLFAAHRVGAVIAAEQRGYSDAVDSITFVTASAPAVLFAVLTNVTWAGKAVADAWRHQSYRAFAWLGAGAAVWVLAALAVRLV